MQYLDIQAQKIRQGVIETVYRQKQGHLGGPLSMADILAVLYFDVLNIDPTQPQWEDRDRFVLSKGHSGIALYVALALRGYFPYEELFTFDELHSRLQAHPDMTKLPGIDMSTGSLGQGFSAAVGMALGAKLQGKAYKTYCLLGDGESQEGQVWEAAHVATRYKLNNLIVILDNNRLQQYGWANENIKSRRPPDSNPAEKWKAFGWNVLEIDGHDTRQIKQALTDLPNRSKRKPSIIIAHTIKGKGVRFMENQFKWHSNVPTKEEYHEAMKQLKEGIPQ
ncbi:transketolase [Bacillus carboniphilus]|uniref:Transketolase n=1 Tax=Bacillus carboniphilus TaxID=86663 RepID=A0ABN0VTS6_9BACI